MQTPIDNGTGFLHVDDGSAEAVNAAAMAVAHAAARIVEQAAHMAQAESARERVAYARGYAEGRRGGLAAPVTIVEWARDEAARLDGLDDGYTVASSGRVRVTLGDLRAMLAALPGGG